MSGDVSLDGLVDPTDLTAALWELARNARWFSGRSRGGRPAGLHLGRTLTGHGCSVAPAVLDVRYADGTTERYHVPLVLRTVGSGPGPALLDLGDGRELAEAVDDPQAMRVLLEHLAGSAPGFELLSPVPTDLPARRYTGEQSNTTVFFGTQLLCKVFRRLEDGPNVDVELHRELAGTGTVAELHGVWRDEDADLAVFLEAFSDPIDGYVAACDAARAGRSFDDHADALGRTLRRVHATLADRLPTTSLHTADLAKTFRRRLSAAASEVPRLRDVQSRVEARYADLGDQEIPAQRIHGDCHLGQVLLTAGVWRYVDFEGEPLKSLEERREPDSPWRDVAGMLRSFDYAAASAPDGAPEWRRHAREAFLRGYSPDGPDTALLEAFETDKAVYEVVYESRNRPHMIHVPLTHLDPTTEGAHHGA